MRLNRYALDETEKKRGGGGSDVPELQLRFPYLGELTDNSSSAYSVPCKREHQWKHLLE